MPEPVTPLGSWIVTTAKFCRIGQRLAVGALRFEFFGVLVVEQDSFFDLFFSLRFELSDLRPDLRNHLLVVGIERADHGGAFGDAVGGGLVRGQELFQFLGGLVERFAIRVQFLFGVRGLGQILFQHVVFNRLHVLGHALKNGKSKQQRAAHRNANGHAPRNRGDAASGR